MAVSQTVVSQTVSVSVSVPVSVSVSVVSIGLRLPLVQSVDVLEGVSAGVELADSVSGSHMARQTVHVVETETDNMSVSVDPSLGLGAPLAESMGRCGHVGSGVSTVVSNAKSVSVDGGGVSISVDGGVSVSVVRVSLSAPLANVVSTASVTGGLVESVSEDGGGRPGRSHTSSAYKSVGVNSEVSVSISLGGGEGGHSQTGGDQEFLHSDDTHRSTEL